MRVVDLQELCQQPNGAIFSSVERDEVSGLYRRGKSLRCDTHDPDGSLVKYYKGIYSDFLYHSLLAEPAADTAGITKDIQFSSMNHGGRWGNFDPDELFVLYDPGDIYNIICLLTDPSAKQAEDAEDAEEDA